MSGPGSSGRRPHHGGDGRTPPAAHPGPQPARTRRAAPHHGPRGAGRRRAPRDDLVSALVTADVDGRGLTRRELGVFFSLLLVAGVETTRNAIGHGLVLLPEHPDQRAILLGDLDGALPDRRRRDRADRDADHPVPSDARRRPRGGRAGDGGGRQRRPLLHLGQPRRGRVRRPVACRPATQPQSPRRLRWRRAALLPRGAPRTAGDDRPVRRALPPDSPISGPGRRPTAPPASTTASHGSLWRHHSRLTTTRAPRHLGLALLLVGLALLTACSGAAPGEPRMTRTNAESRVPSARSSVSDARGSPLSRLRGWLGPDSVAPSVGHTYLPGNSWRDIEFPIRTFGRGRRLGRRGPRAPARGERPRRWPERAAAARRRRSPACSSRAPRDVRHHFRTSPSGSSRWSGRSGHHPRLGDERHHVHPSVRARPGGLEEVLEPHRRRRCGRCRARSSGSTSLRRRGPDAVPWTQCYPGDDTVDIIGMDSYDQPSGLTFDEQVERALRPSGARGLRHRRTASPSRIPNGGSSATATTPSTCGACSRGWTSTSRCTTR